MTQFLHPLSEVVTCWSPTNYLRWVKLGDKCLNLGSIFFICYKESLEEIQCSLPWEWRQLNVQWCCLCLHSFLSLFLTEYNCQLLSIPKDQTQKGYRGSLMLSRVWLSVTPPGFFVQGFLRQEYWSELPFPPVGDLRDLGILWNIPRSNGALFWKP